MTAQLLFFAFLAITLGITWWAARKTRTADHFYAAGRSITALQNGFALAGDYMSASSFLGISGLVALSGFDGLIYAAGGLVGWPIVLFLIAEPLRNLGKYTFADVLAARLRQVPVRLAAAVGTLATVSLYLIAQMVGAGGLIRLLFGLPYEAAVGIVGVAMIAYVLFGGMLATTWVQIVKAALLLAGALLLTGLVLAQVGASPLRLFAAAAALQGLAVLAPGKLVANPVDAISLGLALMFGTAGLPHILMRFYTVPDARAARRSVFFATGLIGLFFLLTFVIGFGAMLLVGPEAIRAADPGGNMAAPLLAERLGGTGLLGFVGAVAFATILAVVAGLALAGASAVSHDLYAIAIMKGSLSEEQEVRASKIATLFLGAVAVILGIMFEKHNLAYLSGLTLGIAASANFPVLILSMYWKGLTTRGAVLGGLTGLISSTAFVILSGAVWVTVLGYDKPIFPYSQPALFSMPLAFLVTWLASVTDNSPRAAKERAAFEDQQVVAETGLQIHR